MDSKSVESIPIEQRASVLAALGDPIRLSILDHLVDERRCVCTLQEDLDIAPNLLSYHLRVLREAGLVVASRRGRWVDYELAGQVEDVVAAVLPAGLIPAGPR